MNTPKTHDNHTVYEFLADYFKTADVCSEYPQIDDIFSGVLAAKTAGDTATRALSRSTLFTILQRCPIITVKAIDAATSGRYSSPRSLTGYAAAARVTSTAIAGFIAGLPSYIPRRLTVKQEQEALDAPYSHELAAMGLV